MLHLWLEHSKNLILIVILFLKVSNGYTQTYNPYDEFGYTIKNEYVRTNIESGIYLTNEDTSAKVKSIVIGSRSKKIYILDKKDSIVESYDIPESALTKFLSVDPITKKYPELTPYQFASNSPIIGVDQDGLELYITTKGELLGSFGKSTDLRIVTDANVQNQIRTAASSNLTKQPIDYPSYHTSLTVLQATQDMLQRAKSTTVAEGYSAVVSYGSVISGPNGPAFLSTDLQGNNSMMTPEGVPNFTLPSDKSKNENVTIIHSHVVQAFSYNLVSKKFLLLPFGTDVSKTNLFINSTYDAFNVNAQNALQPTYQDTQNAHNASNFNWILIGNLTPVNMDGNNVLTPGTQGAIFYKGNIQNESFRLNEAQLNELQKNAEVQTGIKILSNNTSNK